MENKSHSIPLSNKEKKSLYDKERYQKRKDRFVEYYQQHREEKLKYRAEYLKNNKKKIANQRSKYRERNKSTVTNYNRIYNQKNKEKIAKQKAEWYQKNKEKIAKQNAEWYQKNKQRVYNNVKKKYDSDPNFKLSILLRSRIGYALKSTTMSKSNKTEELLGCTFKQAKEYLQSLFEQGMTWENNTVDGWHVDHIIPCAFFDLSDLEQQKKCFHYTNLKPIWAAENKSKSSIYNGKKHYYIKHTNYSQ